MAAQLSAGWQPQPSAGLSPCQTSSAWVVPASASGRAPAARPDHQAGPGQGQHRKPAPQPLQQPAGHLLGTLLFNEPGAYHVTSELAGVLVDIGVNVPGQSWTYCNVGPGPSYLEIDQGHAWSASAGRAAAGNLVAIAHTL
jgi:hypothetical protein